jgi:hypothetical protein
MVPIRKGDNGVLCEITSAEKVILSHYLSYHRRRHINHDEGHMRHKQPKDHGDRHSTGS